MHDVVLVRSEMPALVVNCCVKRVMEQQEQKQQHYRSSSSSKHAQVTQIP